jgi:hypothetical protein
LAVTAAPKHAKVDCGGKSVEGVFSFDAGVLVVSLKRPAVVEAGQRLVVRLR